MIKLYSSLLSLILLKAIKSNMLLNSNGSFTISWKLGSSNIAVNVFWTLFPLFFSAYPAILVSPVIPCLPGLLKESFLL